MEITTRGLLPELLVVGIPHIDAQHEGIFCRIETLKAACLESNTLPVAVADDLLAYLETHFLTEEAAARQALIEFSDHTRKHRATLAALNRWVSLVLSGQRDVFSLLRYLEIWFERHILEDDKPFCSRLLDKNLPDAAP